MTLHIKIENANKGNNKSAQVITRDRQGDVIVETSRQTVKEGETISVYATDSRSFEINEIEEAQTATETPTGPAIVKPDGEDDDGEDGAE